MKITFDIDNAYINSIALISGVTKGEADITNGAEEIKLNMTDLNDLFGEDNIAIISAISAVVVGVLSKTKEE